TDAAAVPLQPGSLKLDDASFPSPVSDLELSSRSSHSSTSVSDDSPDVVISFPRQQDNEPKEARLNGAPEPKVQASTSAHDHPLSLNRISREQPRDVTREGSAEAPTPGGLPPFPVPKPVKTAALSSASEKDESSKEKEITQQGTISGKPRSRVCFFL